MVSSTAIITYNGKILLILRDNKPEIPNPNMWSLPGGGAEEGETLEENIRRECYEEICVNPINVKYIGKNEKGNGRFYAELTDEEYNRIMLGNEGQELGFFSLNEIRKMHVTPGIRRFLDRYYESLEKIVRGENITAKELGLI